MASALCAAALCGSMAAFAGCGGTPETINVTGSTSVQEIMVKLAGEYEKKNNVRINIDAQGSGVGIQNTIDGTNDFGMSSRNLTPEEKDKGLSEQKLCTDGIVLAVGKNCTVTQATNEELYGLYIDGTEFQSIKTGVAREASSGTREAFDEKIKGSDGVSIKSAKKQYNKTTISLEASSTGLVIDAIKNDANNKTVGYISLGSYLKNTDTLKALEFKAKGANSYVAATVANVQNGSYALQRPFVIVTKNGKEMSATVKAFYDWMFGEEAKAIISANGYVL